MNILVFSETHGLLPFAWRLLKDSAHFKLPLSLELLVERERWATAWAGKLDEIHLKTGPPTSGQHVRDRRFLEGLREAVEEKQALVLTDSRRALRTFAGYPKLFAFLPPRGAAHAATWVGAWFDGEGFSGRHLLVPDEGLWPGGLGPRLWGGLTLVRPQNWHEDLEAILGPLVDELKAAGFKGLLQATQAKDSSIVWRAGWPWLHTHAFVAELGDGGGAGFLQVLEGYEAAFAHRYTVVIPVTQSPWPHRFPQTQDRPAEVELPGEVLATGAVFLHDFQSREGSPRTAGLDGLVGVVRASADTLYKARAEALELASALAAALPEGQWRPDVARRVEGVVAGLEGRGVIV